MKYADVSHTNNSKFLFYINTVNVTLAEVEVYLKSTLILYI